MNSDLNFYRKIKENLVILLWDNCNSEKIKKIDKEFLNVFLSRKPNYWKKFLDKISYIVEFLEAKNEEN